MISQQEYERWKERNHSQHQEDNNQQTEQSLMTSLITNEDSQQILHYNFNHNHDDDGDMVMTTRPVPIAPSSTIATPATTNHEQGLVPPSSSNSSNTLNNIAMTLNYEKATIHPIPNNTYTVIMFPANVKNVSN